MGDAAAEQADDQGAQKAPVSPRQTGGIVTVGLEQRLAGAPADRYVELRPAVEYQRVAPRLVNPELPRPMAKVRYAEMSVGRSVPLGMATFRDVTLSWGTTIEFGRGAPRHQLR